MVINLLLYLGSLYCYNYNYNLISYLNYRPVTEPSYQDNSGYLGVISDDDDDDDSGADNAISLIPLLGQKFHLSVLSFLSKYLTD